MSERTEVGGETLRPDRGRAATASPARTNPFTRSKFTFYVFISPWLIGFLIFTFGPFIASFWLSFQKYDVLSPPSFLGLGNFRKMFFEDPLYPRALWNTFYYTVVSVPLKQIIALTLAVLLNQDLKGIYLYRTAFYLPAVTSGVAMAVLWSQVFGYNMGVLNAGLHYLGIPPQAWLTNLKLAMPTLIFISIWNVGNIFVIYLAGLQGVPSHLYEAAEVDGANTWHKFIHVTIPMITPTIFFNVVMGFIGSFQVFTEAFIITNGGPANRTLFYALHLWRNAFHYFRMGYSSAMAWVLFAIILALTMVQLRLSGRWVYYEAAAQEDTA